MPRSAMLLCCMLALSIAGSTAVPAHAAWPRSAADGLAITTQPYHQSGASAVADGVGGMVVAWRSVNSGSGWWDSLRVSHVLRAGALDPAWPPAGRAIAPLTANGQWLRAVSDDAGGAFLTWEDRRSGNADIYVSHVTAAGTVAPGWPAGGLLVCNAALDQLYPVAVPDGSGGAIVAWQDGRGIWDVYAHHVLASGAVDPAWTANGVAICVAANGQGDPVLCSDGAGGAIIAWNDFRSSQWDIYAQHVRANGTVDPVWTANGSVVCSAASHQNYPRILADGAGGALLAWEDRRAGSWHVYAIHINPYGTRDEAWPANGLAIANASTSAWTLANESLPRTVSDGAGGMYVTWIDDRNAGVLQAYAQRVNVNGTIASGWPAQGLRVAPTSATQRFPQLAAGSDGAYVCWEDLRNASATALYAMRLPASGVADPAWPVSGMAVMTKTSSTTPDSAVIVADGRGGAEVVYTRYRNTLEAARLWPNAQFGPDGAEIEAVTDVPNDEGGWLALRWMSSIHDPDPFGANLDQYSLWRELPAASAWKLAAVSPEKVRALSFAGQTRYWEWLSLVPAAAAAEYTVNVPTYADSAPGTPRYVSYMVMGERGLDFFASDPVAGQSLDNITPAPPVANPGTYEPFMARVSWQPVVAPDLRGYRFYKGDAPGYPLDAAHRVLETTSTTFAITSETLPALYVTSIDVHGNESAGTPLPLAVITAATAPPMRDALERVAPDPASRTTTIAFSIARRSVAAVSVYDASGRRVRRVASGVREAGRHEAAWDLRDDDGRPVPAGLYFVRAELAGTPSSRRLVVVR